MSRVYGIGADHVKIQIGSDDGPFSESVVSREDAYGVLQQLQTLLNQDIRQIPIPPAASINAWIDSEIAKAAQGTSLIGRTEAAEIARGACLAIIADRETLIKNLRGAGYTVIEPSKGVQEI